MDEWLILLVYGFSLGLLAGFMGGVLSGLAGLGGGLIYVPLFYFFLPMEQTNIALAVIISMCAVCMTSFFSSRAHWRLGHIQVHGQLLFALIIGATFGLWMTLHWPTWLILLGMASLNIWLALDMAKEHRDTTGQVSAFWGLPIGFISGSIGIGGGTMLVPLLRRTLALRFAVGTSVFCGALMSLLAVCMNMMGDARWWYVLQPHTHIILSLLLSILAALPLSTTWASKLHQTYPEHRIRLILQLFFFMLATVLLCTSAYHYVT